MYSQPRRHTALHFECALLSTLNVSRQSQSSTHKLSRFAIDEVNTIGAVRYCTCAQDRTSLICRFVLVQSFPVTNSFGNPGKRYLFLLHIYWARSQYCSLSNWDERLSQSKRTRVWWNLWTIQKVCCLGNDMTSLFTVGRQLVTGLLGKCSCS